MEHRRPEELWREIEREGFYQLYAKLLAYTRLKVRDKIWRNIRNGELPGLTVEDLPMRAIQLVAEGHRHWNRDMNLLDCLKQIISSEINHLAVGSENQTERMPAADSVPDDSRMIEIEDQEEFLNSYTEYPLERKIMLAILDKDLFKPKEIAEELIDKDLSDPLKIAEEMRKLIKAVNNFKRRLKRKLMKPT